MLGEHIKSVAPGSLSCVTRVGSLDSVEYNVADGGGEVHPRGAKHDMTRALGLGAQAKGFFSMLQVHFGQAVQMMSL